MIFAIGIVLAYIGWVLKVRGLEGITAPQWRFTLSGILIICGLFMMVLSIAIMAWGILP